MFGSLYARERDDLLKRIRPGTSQAADFTKAVSRCFECADAVAQRRRELTHDTALTPAQRKEELARMVERELFPDLAGLVQPAKQAKALVAAERRKYPQSKLDKGLGDLNENAALVDAALYFASREMAGVGDLTRSDFEMLTQPGVSG